MGEISGAHEDRFTVAAGREQLIGAIARARRILERVAGTDAFHARAVAERLLPRWDAAELPAADLVAAAGAAEAEIRAAIAARLSAQAGSEVARATLVSLLRADREAAVRACDTLHAAAGACDGADESALEGLLRGGTAVLASHMLAVLELRALAEREPGERHPTWLDAEHEHWRAVARGEEARAIARALEPRASGPPLEKRVVLVAASDLRSCAELAWALESRGATTILAEGDRVAREMLRFFEVDAIVASISRPYDRLIELAHAVRSAGGRCPCSSRSCGRRAPRSEASTSPSRSIQPKVLRSVH